MRRAIVLLLGLLFISCSYGGPLVKDPAVEDGWIDPTTGVKYVPMTAEEVAAVLEKFCSENPDKCEKEKKMFDVELEYVNGVSIDPAVGLLSGNTPSTVLANPTPPGSNTTPPDPDTPTPPGPTPPAPSLPDPPTPPDPTPPDPTPPDPDPPTPPDPDPPTPPDPCPVPDPCDPSSTGRGKATQGKGVYGKGVHGKGVHGRGLGIGGFDGSGIASPGGRR